MPLLPNSLERLLFVNLNIGPAPLLDIFGAVGFRVVWAAVRLGVFDALAAGPLTPAEVARQINADERGIIALLQAVESLGYVRMRDGRFANTNMTAKWLVSASPTNFAPGFDYWGVTLPALWANLEDSIRTGQPQVNLYEWIEHQPETSRAFQEYMVSLARMVGDEIVAKLKLPAGATRVLDVGGGHGMYSIALCRRHPQVEATVFDSPEAVKTARATIADEGMTERVSVEEGNFMQDDLGSGYDAALVFNIVHGFQPEQNVDLFRRVACALNPGGQIIVAEQIAGKAPGPASTAINALFRLTYIHLLQGGEYTHEEIAGWLKEAGFVRPRRVNLFKAPGTSLIIGTCA